MVNLIDRLVGYINPIAGLKRHAYRRSLARAYEGASKVDGWRVKRPGASPNADHAADAGELRSRARSLYQNVPYIRRGINADVANLIGTGIRPRFLATNERDRKALTEDFLTFANECDADGRTNFDGLLKQAILAAKVDGECLIRIRPRRADSGLRIPIQFQILEIDYLDGSKDGANGNNLIINGIEYDAIGRVTGYYLFAEHPGENTRYRLKRQQSTFIPAASVIHYFNAERPGQGRGFSQLASVIAPARDYQTYADAELNRKNLETRLAVIATGDVSQLADGQPMASPSDATQNATNLGDFAGGSITELPAGLDLTVIEPKAAPGYVDYGKFHLHLIAAGMGVTYEMATGDVRETTFSSARIGRLEYQRGAEQEQYLSIIPGLVAKLTRAYIDASALIGRISVPDYAAEYSTPKWPYVNPAQDVAADVEEIKNGLSSLSEKLRVRGYNPETVFTEIETDAARMKTIILPFLAAMRGDPPAAVAASAAAPAKRTDDSPDSLLAAFLAKLAIPAERSADPAAPTINIHNHPAETHVTLPAPEVRIDNKIEAPEAPVVNVTNQVNPTEVRIENNVQAKAPDVHIDNHPPAAPDINVTVAAPKRTVTIEHERDTQGRIAKSTTREH